MSHSAYRDRFVEFDQGLSYDEVGNRTSQSGTYDAGNRITALEGFTFEYDADGNVTSKSGNGLSRTYTWDAENRLLSIAYSGPSGNFTVGFDYDASGRLVRRTKAGLVDRWLLWDGDALLAELDSSFKRVAEYVYLGIDQPLAMILGDTTATSMEYLEQDSRGNVIGSRVGGTVQQTIAYRDWGGRGREGASANNLSWKGLLAQSQDDVLYYMRARWYDSNTGRFLSEDPIGLAGGINQYAFVNDDPINGWDPSGMRCRVSFLTRCTLAVARVYGRMDPEHWGRGLTTWGSDKPWGMSARDESERARSERAAPGGRGGGRSTSVTPGRSVTERVRACSSQLIGFGASVAADALFVTGAGISAKLAIKAGRQFRMARMFVRGSDRELLHRYTGRGLATLSAGTAAATAEAYWGPDAIQHALIAGASGWIDIIPVVGTLVAGFDAAECLLQ